MAKKLLILLLASGSFTIVSLLIANSVQAAPIVTDNVDGSTANSSILANLSLVSPNIIWNESQSNPILHSMGCACATCTGASQQISI